MYMNDMANLILILSCINVHVGIYLTKIPTHLVIFCLIILKRKDCKSSISLHDENNHFGAEC